MLNRTSINQALTATPDCLTLPELEKLAEESSPNNPHLAQCPRCQAEVAMLKSFESSTPLPDEGAAVAWISARMERQLGQIKHPTTSRVGDIAAASEASWLSRWLGSRRVLWLVPVAALLVAVAAGVLTSRRSKEPELRADAGNGPVVYRSQEIEVTGPAGELVEAPKSLQWKAFAGTAEYKVSIMEVDEVPLWSGQTRDSIVTIPNATRAKLLPGKPVLWRVTALDSLGHVLAVSQMQRFSVQRKSSRTTSGVLSQ